MRWHAGKPRAHENRLWALQLHWAEVDRRATCERSLQTEREEAVDRCGGTCREKYRLSEGEVGSEVGRLFQRLTEVQDKEG